MCDNVSTHPDKTVQAWLKARRALGCNSCRFTAPGINQVERWFSSHQRKHLRVADFDALEQHVLAFIAK